MSSELRPLLVIACGALAHDLVRVREANNWPFMEIKCLPADLHNRPKLITDTVRQKIHKYRNQYQQIFVAYADCGTGGSLDRMLAEESIERLPGAHCYEFFAGHDVFAGLHEAELGTFYLTDYLVRHFQRLMIKGFGIDRHPEIKDMLFGNYRKLVYLAQCDDAELDQRAADAAQQLGLQFERRHTGDQPFTSALAAQTGLAVIQIDPPVYRQVS